MRAPNLLILLCLALPIYSERVEYQAGLLKRAITPSADFFAAFYRHDGYRIGAYSAPTRRGVVASYSSGTTPFIFEVGNRERSLENGFLVSNGAWLPWARNFAFAEPMGLRTGYSLRYASFDSQFYQLEAENLAASRLSLTPVSWFALGGGVAARNVQQESQLLPLAALAIGRQDADGFFAGADIFSNKNYLLHARYRGAFALRSLYFQNAEINPLASGIYENREGFAVQFFERNFFAQYFATDSRFGMLRYSDDLLAGVFVHEDRMQLAGLSLRSAANTLHARVGASVAQDTSIQTLLGLGFRDAVFVGGGHFELFSEQMLDPIIFPAEWYTSVLLQSSSMRIRNRGYKLLALVDTEAVQGFFAVVYSQDVRGRERFEFYLRLAGGVTF